MPAKWSSAQRPAPLPRGPDWPGFTPDHGNRLPEAIRFCRLTNSNDALIERFYAAFAATTVPAWLHATATTSVSLIRFFRVCAGERRVGCGSS